MKNEPRIEPKVREFLKETGLTSAYGRTYFYARHVHNGETLEQLEKVLEGDMSNKEKVDYALSEVKSLLALNKLVIQMEKELQELMKDKN